MFRNSRALLFFVVILGSLFAAAQGMPDPHVSEHLGEVSFPISCKAEVQPGFNRGVALLHSFAYVAAEGAFHDVANRDPQCAMAHWGIAMTHFHQLWEPPIPPGSALATQHEIEEGLRIGAGTDRERKFLSAAGLIFRVADSVPYRVRTTNYEKAMYDLARENPADPEAQVFYALALLADASPTDKTHAKQKQAADLLESLFRHPQHPGIAHYLIHACDNSELAQRGLPAARLYSTIAPSVPHALHMPSHIFTRLGLWDDSIASNMAARAAAHRLGDTGEELHAMDYLVYAYLQSGHDADAAQIVEELRRRRKLDAAEFKIGYAATAIPVRYYVERRQWTDAAVVVAPAAAPPQVVATAVWARGLGLVRSGRVEEARQPIADLQKIEAGLQASGNDYWATQVRILKREVMAWSAQSEGKAKDAVALMRQAADEEDSIEKLPVTPGPIVPAREQLGELLLLQGQLDLASKEFQTTLVSTPGRRDALRGAALVRESLRQK
jgi:hypothetical protein